MTGLDCTTQSQPDWWWAYEEAMKAFVAKHGEPEGDYPQVVPVDHMPMDHYDSGRGYSHCTGREVRLTPDLTDSWYEYYDDRTGETFLAR